MTDPPPIITLLSDDGEVNRVGDTSLSSPAPSTVTSPTSPPKVVPGLRSVIVGTSRGGEGNGKVPPGNQLHNIPDSTDLDRGTRSTAWQSAVVTTSETPSNDVDPSTANGNDSIITIDDDEDRSIGTPDHHDQPTTPLNNGSGGEGDAEQTNSTRLFSCPECGKTYATEKSLRQHQTRRTCPAKEEMIDGWCCLCRTTVPEADRTDHYLIAHDELTITREIVDSPDEYIEMKKKEHANSCYRISLFTNRSRSASTKTYICSAAQEQRESRSQPHAKIRTPQERGGIVCSCFIRMRKLPNGKALVESCDEHSHLGDINMMPCDEDTVNVIKTMLMENRSTKFILDHFNKPAYDKKGALVRSDVINSSDVRNVRARFKIGKDHELDKNDLISTTLTLEKLKDQEDSPVFYHSPEDGAFGIATNFMLDQCNEHAPKGACLDSTHGVAANYNAVLFTILVINQFCVGVPVMFGVIRQESEVNMTPMFEAFRQRMIKRFGRMPDVALVMTDDAPGIWNSWMAVFFSDPLVHRLCYWHIERAWRTQIKEKLAGTGTEETRTQIYETTLKAMEMLAKLVKSRAEFDQAVIGLRNFLNERGCHVLVAYLDKKYFAEHRVSLWGAFARINDLFATNMFIESYHSNMKTNVMGRATVYRFDAFIIVVLLPLAQYYEHREHQFVIGRKGYGNKTRYEINNRKHVLALEWIDSVGGNEAMMEKIIVDEEMWKVPSQSKDNLYYAVTRTEFAECSKVVGTQKCSSLCGWPNQCGSLCQCLLKCSCHYGLARRWEVSCKHIHMLFITLPKPIAKPVVRPVSDDVVVVDDSQPSTSAMATTSDADHRARSSKMLQLQSNIATLSLHVRDIDFEKLCALEEMSATMIKDGGFEKTAATFDKHLSQPISNVMTPQHAVATKKKNKAKRAKPTC